MRIGRQGLRSEVPLPRGLRALGNDVDILRSHLEKANLRCAVTPNRLARELSDSGALQNPIPVRVLKCPHLVAFGRVGVPDDLFPRALALYCRVLADEIGRRAPRVPESQRPILPVPESHLLVLLSHMGEREV